MRRLLAILGFGTAAFLAVAMLQEWRLFAAVWFGSAADLPVVSESERGEASAVVEEALTLERHLYASGGDPRFADRMPVSDEMREEMAAEIEYLTRNRRRQELDLHRFEINDARRLDGDHLEVRTREYWTIRTLELDGSRETDPARPEVLDCRYLLTRAGDSWRVERLELVPPGGGSPR